MMLSKIGPSIISIVLLANTGSIVDGEPIHHATAAESFGGTATSNSNRRRLNVSPRQSIADEVRNEKAKANQEARLARFALKAEVAGTEETFEVNVIEATPAVTSSTTTSVGGSNEQHVDEGELDDMLVSDEAGTVAIIGVNKKTKEVNGIVVKGNAKGKKFTQQKGQKAWAFDAEPFEPPAWSCGYSGGGDLDAEVAAEEESRRLAEEHHHDHEHNHNENAEAALDELRSSLQGSNLHLGKRRKLQGGTHNFSYQVDVYIEIDYQLCNDKGGGCSNGEITTNTLNYVNALFAGANTIYEEEIDTHLNVLHIDLNTNYDGYANGQIYDALLHMRSLYAGPSWHYTQPNTGAIPDLHHALLSRSLGGGIAYSSQIGSSYYGFGVSGDLSGGYSSMGNNVVWDMFVFMHELGHNFGSGHTHDGGYSPQIDTCGCSYATNTDCKLSDGVTKKSCPSGLPLAKSTSIMSYCHVCSGGFGNLDYTFGGKYKGTGSRSDINSYDNSPLAGDISSEPRQVPARMYAHVYSRRDKLDITVPAGSSTSSPTSKPTPFPTHEPTTESDFVCTCAPVSQSPTTSKPTNVPTQKPTAVPTNIPTLNPTAVPTQNPTAEPTNNPTASPTSQPTNIDIIATPSISCPQAGSMTYITGGLKSIPAAAPNTFCGIFLKKSSGTLIPLARSYHGHEWEAAPGPLACPSQDVNSTHVKLPDLQDPADLYVVISKDGNLDDRKRIARFLEMTTFGPKMSEIAALESGAWDDNARANYVRTQMDLPKTSHREYFRKRTNVKWDATAQVARSNHPCDANSKWRTYSFIKEDRSHTIDNQYIPTDYETVPEEADLTYTIHETDVEADVTSFGNGRFASQATVGWIWGYSGAGYYDFAGTNDHLELQVNMATNGTYPIAFRYSQGSTSYGANWKCQLWVNGALFMDVYDFKFTGSWRYWMYSELVEVPLVAGVNTFRLVVVDQNGGPNIDHLRIGKPPAMLMKQQGHVRAVAKNGICFLDKWPCELNGITTTLPWYPEPAMGERGRVGGLRVALNGEYLFLDIGNPTLDFTGYEQYLPANVFTFTTSDLFEESSSDLYSYPLLQGQEMLLTNGSTDPVCGSIPPFKEEYDAPVIGILPSGQYVQWSPTIILEDNGPSINAAPQDMATNVMSDGGGEAFIQTNEMLKCANAQRTVFNKDLCFLSTESTACSALDPVGEVLIPMTTSNVIEFYTLTSRYVYAVRGLVMEDLSEHACRKSVSRWTFETSTCSAPTQLGAATITALTSAISGSSDENEFVKDVTRTLACDSSDETTSKMNIQIQIGADCYTHVHPDHLSVFDFTAWVSNHPGGEYNIEKWAQGFEGVEGWYLDFPSAGVPSRGVPQHPMSRWYDPSNTQHISYVARLGDSIAYRDLPNDLMTDAIARAFGATPQSVIDGGVVVCGSTSEVSNDPTLREVFAVRSNEHTTQTNSVHANQKHVVWTEIALYGQDQLRQRMAWALAQIVTTVPGNIGATDLTEVYTNYYDIFVRNAFGNYRDILAEASYSSLMAEHLSYLGSTSHSYTYDRYNKRISAADENFAREVMQLFSIGLIVLNDDGTPKLDPATGKPLQTYTNEDIESFARAWTGFQRRAVRGNYEESSIGTSSNKLDPMRILPEWRDPFPKHDLNGGYIGDSYALCKDLPAQAFLKKGAGYRILGGKSSPEMMKDPSYFDDDFNGILRFELDPSSQLYQRLSSMEVFVELENDLPCTANECNVDTLRVVKVGSTYYEYVERPCVQLAFYNDGKQIMGLTNSRLASMCANPELAHAREACCRETHSSQVNTATLEQGVTYLYEGERMKWATAQSRCATAHGKDLCVYENLSLSPNNDWQLKQGYHWTNRECGIMVKINPEGYVAIVHDAMSTYKDTIPWLVAEQETLNWFRVNWNRDPRSAYPHPGSPNTCAANSCKTMSDGSCLCKTQVTEDVVFTSDNVSKEDVISQLYIGAFGPEDGSIATDLGNGVTIHKVGGNVDGSTVFEVQEKGKTLYLKNLVSTVNLTGWTMTPQIYEAEDATTINNAIARSDTNSATGGWYVDAHYGNETTFIEWDVSVPTTGAYLISLRYAMDYSPRPLNVFVNSQEVRRQLDDDANLIIPIDSIANTPPYPLDRCAGDCDYDSHCAPGLFCMMNNRQEAVPGCSGTTNSGWDYCADINDFDYGFNLLPTGGWNDDWHLSKKLEVFLNAGSNTIRVQIPIEHTVGVNIDHLIIEGLPTSTSHASFRNPPHFMALIPEKDNNSEQTLRDAQYETEAVLDHYFYHDNVAPFLCIRIMQRFSFSNPSPRFVSSCVNAFRTGSYTSGTTSFGSGEYGSLEAMVASIILDKEATEVAVSTDPSYGSVREPILKVTNLMRSMEYETSTPSDLAHGTPLQADYQVKLWFMHDKIGHSPYEFPSVFSFMLPEYVPDAGPNLFAKLTSPETGLLTMPGIIALMNGMFSLIKYGLSDCYGGFTKYPGYGGCSDNGQYARSLGHLFYEPTGADDHARAANLALLLTAGRLSADSINTIVSSCSTEPDQPSKNRCMQQLIVSTAEFHTTSTIEQSGEGRATDIAEAESTEPYKAIVYFYLAGGLDSYNMLAPHTCSPIDVHERYMTIRGKSDLSDGVGLPKTRLLEINANNPAQPCSSFGIHENLPKLKQLYDQGKLKFIANAGLLAKPVTVADYTYETPVQLFAHNDMSLETKKEDIFETFAGTGVGGRITDVLKEAGIPGNLFSISGQQILLTGEVGAGPSQYIVSSGGLAAFNQFPSIDNMEDVIKDLNKDTLPQSGFHGETWSAKLTESLDKQALLKREVDATTTSTSFPNTAISNEFKMVTRIMQTREARGSKRDIFYVDDGGYDTHADVDDTLVDNFNRINAAISSFVTELQVLGLWESTVVVQFSEFARTLDPNTGEGTDHAWGGNHFIFGGALNGGQVLGQYPSDFVQGDSAGLALSRGRMIPTSPWDAMWKPVAEWFGVPANSAEMDKVLPMHKNFPVGVLYSEADFFDEAAAGAPAVGSPQELDESPMMVESIEVVESTPQEIVERIANACSPETLLDMGDIWCRELCHGKRCCFESGPDSCENDESMQCPLYTECKALDMMEG